MKSTNILLLTLLTSLVSTAQAATISGMVIDADKTPLIGIAVFLCDQESGIPLTPTTMRPFTETEQFPQKGLVATVTDESGAFIFIEAPEGTYRLIAQSWPQKEGQINPFDKNGNEVVLHGIINDINVETEDIGKLTMRPLGTGVLVLDKGYPATLMAISTELFPAPKNRRSTKSQTETELALAPHSSPKILCVSVPLW